MSTIDLADTERRAYSTLFDDGLLDILVGSFIVALALSMGTDVDYLPAIGAGLGVPLWVAARRLISEPRIGQVSLHVDRQARIRRGIAMLGGLLALTAAGGVVWFLSTPAGAPALPAAWRAVPLGLVLALTAWATAWIFQIPRMAGHGLVIAAAFVAGAALGLPRGAGPLAAGVVIVAAGIVVLIGFLGRNPKPPAEIRE